MDKPRTYSTAQITLHWLIAALVVFQVLTNDGMVNAWDAYRHGTPATPGDLRWAYIHAGAGVAVLLLAIVRLWIRLTRGAPPLDNPIKPVRWIAWLTHILLYGFIFFMPISGALAWFGGVLPAGEAHSFARLILVPLVLLHTIGALVEHFWFRTESLRRMLGLQPRAAS